MNTKKETIYYYGTGTFIVWNTIFHVYSWWWIFAAIAADIIWGIVVKRIWK